MESKYYIPSIEEFHVGFEYEWLDTSNGEWLKKKHRSLDCPYNSPDKTRVKYLDREDIESLGWVSNPTQNLNPGWLTFNLRTKKYIMLWFKEDEHHVEIDVDNTEYDETRFDGVIKNKSELKKIMEMVGIEL